MGREGIIEGNDWETRGPREGEMMNVLSLRA